jgi:predicted lipid-binding transport protein (Tim44 family)
MQGLVGGLIFGLLMGLIFGVLSSGVIFLLSSIDQKLSIENRAVD